VVTDVGGAAEIRGGFGRVVMSSQVQEAIRQRFDIAVVARRYEDECRSMVASTRRPD